MNKLKIISNLFLFNHTDFEELNSKYKIIENTKEISYLADELILSNKKGYRGIGIILSGKAVIASSVSGKAPTLRNLLEGDTFGAGSLYSTAKEYTTSVIASSDTTVIYIDESTVNMLIKELPQVALNYIEFLSNRIAFLNKKLCTFSFESADAKIAYFLYSQSSNSLDITLPFSYTSLANLLGIGRASLYRSLDMLSEKGIIEKNAKNIIILDKNKLFSFIK